MSKTGIRTSRPAKPDSPPPGRGIRAKDPDGPLSRRPLPSRARPKQADAATPDDRERKPGPAGNSTAQAPPPNALKRIKKAHFLEPYRLCDTVRTALLTCLADQGIGDRESRDLFAAAVEYAIAGCRVSTRVPRGSPDEPAPIQSASGVIPAAEPAIETAAPMPSIAEAARLFLKLLAELNQPARAAIAAQLRASDPFDRAHDQAYLDAISREVERIAEAAACARSDPAPSTTHPHTQITPPQEAKPVSPKAPRKDPPNAPPSDTARRLILSIAHAYDACLETTVEASPGSPFVVVLRLLAADAGIALPQNEAQIAEVLTRD